MSSPVVSALVLNTAVLLSLVLIFDLLLRRAQTWPALPHQALVGLLAGAIGIGVMLSPWESSPGLVFDTRSVLLGTCGLFFGGTATLVAMLVTGAWRLHVGGLGALTGVSVILASGLLGLGWRHWLKLRERPLSSLSLGEAYLFGVALHLVMLSLIYLTLPSSTALDVLSRVALPVLAIYPIATLMLVTLMGDHLRKHGEVSDLRRMGEQLRESESRLTALFDHAGIGIAEMRTADGRFLRVNQWFCDLLGYSADELTGLRFQALTHPDDLQADLDNMALLVAGKSRGFVMEKRYRRKDGSLVWAILRVTPLWAPGETPSRHIAVVEDIDASKRAEADAQAAREQSGRLLEQADLARRTLLSVIEDERLAQSALRESETRLRAVFNQAAVGIARVAPDGSWLEVNRKLCEIVGYGDGEMPGRSFKDITHPDDLDTDLDYLRQVLAGERMAYSMEKRYIRKSGETIWVNLTVSLVRGPEGEPKYFVSVIEDIEQRKQAEQEIRRLNEQLEARVLERTAELEAANKELESFSYSVSHDLRAPLRAITGFTQILVRRHRDRLDDEGRHYLDNVVAAGDQMGSLINDLLQYSRTGRGAVRVQPVALEPIVAGLRSTFAERFGALDASLLIREPLAQPLADPTLIGQVLNNLVENALTYHRVDTAPQIVLEARLRGKRVVISVSDNGIGIDPQYHEKVFQVFQRLHGQDEYPGTGIGLAIVSKAVHLMDGEISLDSAPGEGSRFSISLPAAPRTAKQ